MERMRFSMAALAGITLILAGCSDRGDTVVEPVTVDATVTADSFLTYVNQQTQIGVGEYQVVVSPETDGETGTYQLAVTLPDGSTQTFSGSWPQVTTSSSDESANAPSVSDNLVIISSSIPSISASPSNNPSHSFRIDQSGGLSFQLESSVTGHLYLMKNGSVIADQAGTGTSLSWSVDASQIDSEAYANAYYELVDPNDERTTLADWKQVNGFDQDAGTHVVFRDTKDLGYGRDMYARRSDNGDLAFYVDNYVVILRPGDSANYGPLNLDAALAQDRERHTGTNAIEFTRLDPNDSNSPRVLKFFTFGPEDANGDQARLVKANLDGRGIKYMPTMCLVCHGGTMLPLNADGSFPQQSVLTAKYNRLELNSFEYGDLDYQTRAGQEANFKQMNQWIHQSYQEIVQRNPNTRGKWWGDFAVEIMEGHYGGANLPGDTYQADAIPSGWQASATRPEGVELLYTEVIEPHCLSCHSLRGTEAGDRETTTVNGETISLANAISFSSYEQFISYNDKIIEYVYRRGVMPLSLRNYEQFWDDPNGAPTRLASFLSGFDVFNSNREVVEPGLPYARPGENRRSQSPVQLNGLGSLFSVSYQWQVTDAPVGSTYSFSDASNVSPVFTGDTDGTYELTLTVSNGLGSHSETMDLTIDSQGQDQTALNFVDDIRPILGSDTLAKCSNCHNPTTGRQGIPVYYDDNNPNLYLDVLARVNLAVPGDSLLLLKPTQQQHGGGLQIFRNNVTGEAEYQTLLNWIQEGAVCGTDANFCPN